MSAVKEDFLKKSSQLSLGITTEVHSLASYELNSRVFYIQASALSSELGHQPQKNLPLSI